MLAALVLVMAGCQAGEQRGGLRVTALQLSRDGAGVVVEPKLQLRLSGAVLEALRNGVPVTVLMEARLQRDRHWLWPATEVQHQRRYELTYHSLGDQYLLQRDDQPPRAFPSREAALVVLENPEPWTLAPPVAPDANWSAGVRVHLDLHALPAPLRLVALFSPGWRIGSDWRQEPLGP